MSKAAKRSQRRSRSAPARRLRAACAPVTACRSGWRRRPLRSRPARDARATHQLLVRLRPVVALVNPRRVDEVDAQLQRAGERAHALRLISARRGGLVKRRHPHGAQALRRRHQALAAQRALLDGRNRLHGDEAPAAEAAGADGGRARVRASPTSLGARRSCEPSSRHWVAAACQPHASLPYTRQRSKSEPKKRGKRGRTSSGPAADLRNALISAGHHLQQQAGNRSPGSAMTPKHAQQRWRRPGRAGGATRAAGSASARKRLGLPRVGRQVSQPCGRRTAAHAPGRQGRCRTTRGRRRGRAPTEGAAVLRRSPR